jgi:hypothetical protein
MLVLEIIGMRHIDFFGIHNLHKLSNLTKLNVYLQQILDLLVFLPTIYTQLQFS